LQNLLASKRCARQIVFCGWQTEFIPVLILDPSYEAFRLHCIVQCLVVIFIRAVELKSCGEVGHDVSPAI
jgi:hypothetical protein